MVLRHQIFCLIGWFIVAGKGKRSFLALYFIGKRSFFGSFFIGKRSSNEKALFFEEVSETFPADIFFFFDESPYICWKLY